jgi:hypothetical protein
MRYLLILILTGFFLFESVYSQNIKKILTKEELKQLETNDTLYRQINDVDFDEGFTGTLLIKKKGENIKSIEIGTWIRKDSKHGDSAIMVWDSVGRLIDYKEFNKNKTVSFDCKYWYETINGKYYRLENMTIFDDLGNPIIKGHRYWITTKDEFGFYKSSKKRKFGKWEYLDNQGNLIKTKEYNEIK